MPLIGVTTSEVRLAERVEALAESEPPQVEMALGLKYASAIEAAGGVPVVIPPVEAEAIDCLLETLTGVCISGGPDLHPEEYGAKPHPRLGPTEPDLDRFELMVARAADRRRLPVLGICRGAQALNVARGGTLHQHLPEITEQQHRQQLPGDRPTHWITIERGSRLATAMGRTRARVNSFHHQSVDRLGARLRRVASAPDGIVEGIEAVDRDFLLGVQWHAECLADRRDQAALFGALVDAARAHRDAAGAAEEAA
jgi:putative glutamine amidotransferase